MTNPAPPSSAFSDWVVSQIRVGVAVLVGFLVSWVIKHLGGAGSYLDEAKIDAWLIPVCIVAYYALVRWLELRFPQLGWLLGVAKQPVYPVVAGDTDRMTTLRRLRDDGGWTSGGNTVIWVLAIIGIVAIVLWVAGNVGH